MQVNPVQQRAGNAAQVILNLPRRAARLAGHFAVGCRVHGRHQHELGGKCHRARRARDRHLALFERLAHRFQHAAFELGQLVQEQNAVVRQRDFARRRIDISAQQTGIAGGVVRRAKRPLSDQRLSR